MYLLVDPSSYNLIEFNLSNNISRDALLVLLKLSLKTFQIVLKLDISASSLNMDLQHDILIEYSALALPLDVSLSSLITGIFMPIGSMYYLSLIIAFIKFSKSSNCLPTTFEHWTIRRT